MKINVNSPFAAKALMAFAVLMAFAYLALGSYFIVAGLQKAYWPGVLTGALFILYGSFRSYRSYQKYSHEKD